MAAWMSLFGVAVVIWVQTSTKHAPNIQYAVTLNRSMGPLLDVRTHT